MVRGSGEAADEGRSSRDPVRRRCHLVLRTQGGRGKGEGSLNQAIRQIWFDPSPGEDAASGIWAICGEEREETGKETPDLRVPRLYPHVRPQPEGEVHRAREDDRQTAPQGTEGDRRLVPEAPARAGGRATENPERQAPRPLPVLRTTDELPQSSAVLSERPSDMEGRAESPHARAMADVGPLRGNPTAASVVATPDHAFLERGE